MSVEEIKNSLATLSSAERDQISAYLLHLRNSADPEYRTELTARLNDKNPAHWLSLKEFEWRLEQN